MPKLSLIPLLLAALVSIFFGVRYLFTREFMPYHAVVSGKSWASWAALTISAATLVPTLYVTIMLRRFEPKAKTPIVPTVVFVALVLAGVGASFLT